MHYKLRPGVTLINVCGTDLLVSTHSSWEECAGVRPISLLYAGCVRMLEKGIQEEEIVRIMSKALKRSPESIQERIESVFSNLYQQGFLIVAEDNE